MKTTDALLQLCDYMKDGNLTGSIRYMGETSHLMRAANNQISLNTSETASKFFIELQDGKRFSRGAVSADPGELDKIKQTIDLAAENLPVMPEIPFATPMTPIAEAPACEAYYDGGLERIDSEKMLALFARAKDRFAKRKTALSGAFSCGMYAFGIINTLSGAPLYYKGSDFNIELVLQLAENKKEVRASQVGDRVASLDYDALLDELDALLTLKETTGRIDLEPGAYDVVFGRDALANLLSLLADLACSGEMYEYEMGMLQKAEHKIGDKLLGDNITLVDNPEDDVVLFRRPFGPNGRGRRRFPLFEAGVLKNLVYSDKLDCDRFRKKVNNDASALNLVLSGGDGPGAFEEMVASCDEKTIYIPFIHYMNSPNRAKGEFTGSSRFGTMLMEGGAVRSHLYNLRINDTLYHVFRNLEWLSERVVHADVSDTYGVRMADAVALPAFVKVKNLKITGTSFKGKGENQ
ncbi:MAG: hypothetical protein GY859_30170 [Desulfobacterales bacterium]|nr:hypothetical protein [Desulfobacterales bacterium]